MKQTSLYRKEVSIQKIVAILVAGLMVLGALTFATSVRAEDAEGTVAPNPTLNRPRAEVRKDAMEERQGIRQEGQENMKAIASSTRGEMMEKRGERKGIVVQARKDGTIGTIEFLKAMAENRGDIKQIRDDRRETTKEEWKEVRMMIASTTDEAQKKIWAKRLEDKKRIVEAHGEKAKDRMEAAVERLEKIADRIASRLDKAQEKGKDVSSLRTKLDSAKGKITEAKTAVEGLSAVISEVADMENSADGKKKLQDAFKSAREKIKAAHKALVDVVNSLKGLGSIANSNPTGAPAASSTPPTSTTTNTTGTTTSN